MARGWPGHVEKLSVKAKHAVENGAGRTRTADLEFRKPKGTKANGRFRAIPAVWAWAGWAGLGQGWPGGGPVTLRVRFRGMRIELWDDEEYDSGMAYRLGTPQWAIQEARIRGVLVSLLASNPVQYDLTCRRCLMRQTVQAAEIAVSWADRHVCAPPVRPA